MRDEWRSAGMGGLVQCVMTPGDLQMLVWHAGSSAIRDTVGSVFTSCCQIYMTNLTPQENINAATEGL